MQEGQVDQTIRHDSPSTNAPVDSFMEQHLADITSSVRTTLETQLKDYPDELEEELPEYIDREKGFVTAVIQAYERWSKEEQPIVLWDVDNTIGAYDMKRVWHFRPSFIPLMAFLGESFPSVQNGILSNRTNVEEQLSNSDGLGPIAAFINPQYIYSSRDVGITDEEQMAQQVYAEDNVHPNLDHLQKLNVAQRLQKEGKNVKVIDDNTVAKSMKQDGIYLGRSPAYSSGLAFSAF